MNALEAASLVMIPSGYEDGTLGSLKPIDGSGDFTFSRGSNLSATRVLENGYIEKGYENLLLQSNQFDTTWTTSGTSVTSGQSGYDGSNDAWLLETASNGNRYIQEFVSINSVQSISVYAKAGTTNFLGIQIIGTGSGYSFFNLSNGTLGGSSSVVIDKAIELVSGTTDWYRCSFVINANNTAIRIYPTNADNNFASTTGQNIYIQDAQINQGLVALPYVESGATNGLGGLLENDPRIDFTGGGCGSLLLEPSRTNVITQSEYIEEGLSTNECTQTITNETNPSGNDVSYLTSAIDATNDQMRYNKNGLSSGSYFLSAFVKGNGITNKLRFRGTGGGVSVGNVFWDVASDGTISLNISESPSGVNAITESYGNGWYRIGYEETYDGSSNGRFAIYPSSGDVNASTYLWGVQWEQGSYPTSYIPTYGVSQTRLKDVVIGAGDVNTFNSTEGVLYAEFNAFADDRGGSGYFQISDGTGSNRFYMGNSGAVNSKMGSACVIGGALQWNINSSSNFDVTQFHKVALSYKENDITLYVDGQIQGTDTSAIMAPANTFNVLDFRASLTSNRYGEVKQVLYFPTALTDSECIALTTI